MYRTSRSRTASYPQHFEHCARGLAAQDLQFAQLYAEDSDILHAGIGACEQTFGLLGFWGANGSRAAIPTTPLRTCFWTTGTPGADGQASAGLQGFTSGTSGRSISRNWPVPRSPGRLPGVVFDNVKFGQTRAASDADLGLVVSAGLQRRNSLPTRADGYIQVTPAFFKPGTM